VAAVPQLSTRYLLNIQPETLVSGDPALLAAAVDGAVWIVQPWTEQTARTLRDRWPGTHLVRPYPAPWDGFDCSGWDGIILGNEPNLPPADEAGSWGADPAGYVTARLAVLASLRRATPGARFLPPAVAPVGRWEDALALLAPLVRACGVGNVHRYHGQDGLPTARTVLPGIAEWWVTEQNWPGGDWLWQTGDAAGIAGFAARWSGHAAAGLDALAQPSVLARFAAVRQERDTPVLHVPTAFDTQIGPDGSGHDRCAEACMASTLLDPGGWQSDPYQLLLAVTDKSNTLRAAAGDASRVETSGTTSAQLISLAQSYGFQAQTWTDWQEGVDALAAGKVVLCLNMNALLRPTNYPATAGWFAEHWVRLRQVVDGDYCLLFDPLTYVPQADGTVYQGPTIQTIASLQAAIQATPNAEAGILVWR